MYLSKNHKTVFQDLVDNLNDQKYLFSANKLHLKCKTTIHVNTDHT